MYSRSVSLPGRFDTHLTVEAGRSPRRPASIAIREAQSPARSARPPTRPSQRKNESVAVEVERRELARPEVRRRDPAARVGCRTSAAGARRTARPRRRARSAPSRVPAMNDSAPEQTGRATGPRGPPLLVAGLPQVQHRLVAPQHREPAVVMEHLEPEPLRVERHRRAHLPHRQRRDRAMHAGVGHQVESSRTAELGSQGSNPDLTAPKVRRAAITPLPSGGSRVPILRCDGACSHRRHPRRRGGDADALLPSRRSCIRSAAAR